MDSKTLRSPISVLAPRKPICVNLDTTVDESIKLMKERGIGCVCVVSQDKLFGIFTERDVLTKVIPNNLDCSKTKVGELMSYDPEYLYMEDQVAFAVNRMHVGGFRHIPLIDSKENATGIVSVRDILRYLVKNIQDKN